MLAGTYYYVSYDRKKWASLFNWRHINVWIDFTFPLFNSLCMSLLIAISMLTTVSLQLSTYGWLMHPYNGCSLWLIMLCFPQRINSVSLLQREPADSVSFVLLILVGENGGDATATPLSLQTLFELHLIIEFRNHFIREWLEPNTAKLIGILLIRCFLGLNIRSFSFYLNQWIWL